VTGRQRAAIAALVGLLAGACRLAAVRDEGVALDPGDARAQALLASLVERGARPAGLRAAARLRLDAPGLHLSRPQRIVAEQPAKLRVEVVGLFGQVAGVVATDGERFAFVDLTSGRREQGPVDDALLWRTARVDLTPVEAVDLLLGAPRVSARSTVVAARAFADGAIVMRVHEGDGRGERRVEFDAAGRLRSIERRDAAGRTRWSARYADWREVDGTAFAHRLDLEFPRVSGEASIRFEAVALDPEIPDDLFVLQVPEGSASHR